MRQFCLLITTYAEGRNSFELNSILLYHRCIRDGCILSQLPVRGTISKNLLSFVESVLSREHTLRGAPLYVIIRHKDEIPILNTGLQKPLLSTVVPAI